MYKANDTIPLSEMGHAVTVHPTADHKSTEESLHPCTDGSIFGTHHSVLCQCLPNRATAVASCRQEVHVPE